MEITTVGIVGCGQMGAGIAEVAAKAGFEVMICEVDDGILTSGLAKIDKSLAKAVEKGKLAEADMTDVLSRISGTVSTEDLADCDIVIEAVFEDLDVKRAVFAELDRVVKPEAILASNTSSISIAAIATATQRGDKVIGMHFFNPVPVMALVEYVPSILTSQETIDAVSALGEKLGKTGVLAKDTPGFIVNRLLVAYLLDAIRVYEQGLASREDIDNAMKLGAAHPMGPLTLSDFIGLDVIKQVAQVFFEEYGEPRYSSPPLLTRMVSAGLLGRKSGRGFYDYSKRCADNDAVPAYQATNHSNFTNCVETICKIRGPDGALSNCDTRAGQAGPLDSMMQDSIEQAMWRALRDVIEPDLGESIVDLGLVRAVRAESPDITQIDITLTTPYSPHGEALTAAVRRAVSHAGLPGVEVQLVFEPAWTPYQMAEPLRALLGLPASEPQAPAQVAEPTSWRSRLRRRFTRL